MIKYHFFYPVAYKFFDINSFTKQIYRNIGNTLGDARKSKKGLNKNYISQARKIRKLLIDYCDIQKDFKVLELGTGWIHWYSTFIRLFFDIKIDLFDVWDNRQLVTFKKYFGQLQSFLTEDEKKRLIRKDIISKLTEVNSFEDIYKLLNYKYFLEKEGSLSHLSKNHYDIIFSCAVFEHINRGILPNYFNQMYNILKPGGYLLHIIDMGDHYHYMDKKRTHFKNYLKFSNRVWKNYFENSIFYMNKLQVSDWHSLFQESGFQLVYEEKLNVEINNLKINKDYLHYNIDDLKCHQLVVIYKKPSI